MFTDTQEKESKKVTYLKIDKGAPRLMKKLVFIVEDNPVQQKMLQVHFEQMLGDYTVRTFSRPDDMMPQLKEKPFAVVLDHFFSDKNGRTGLDYLREMRKSYPSIPVIYYTTLEDEGMRMEVKALGVEEYIVKDSASLVRLRTALDMLNEKIAKKKTFLHRLFNR
jgi:CheY-like chemotaxis protein